LPAEGGGRVKLKAVLGEKSQGRQSEGESRKGSPPCLGHHEKKNRISKKKGFTENPRARGGRNIGSGGTLPTRCFGEAERENQRRCKGSPHGAINGSRRCRFDIFKTLNGAEVEKPAA